MNVRMNFIEKMKSFFTPAAGGARRGNRTYVVDGARLVDEKTGRRMAPREQVQMLNALARVAKQESLALQVLFESDRPLREVEDGGDYNGVQVFYAPDGEQLVATALKLCRKGDCMLISSGVTMESRATEAGIPVLCSSTFRKVFLQGGAPSSGERPERNGDRRRNRDRDRRRDRNGNNGGNGSGGNRPPKKPAPDANGDGAPDASSDAPAQGDDNSAVRNLIDLVE
jgi:hypothetical protein